MSLEARLREQLYAAFKASSMTLAELGKASKRANRSVDLDPPALSRKLRGETSLSIDEYKAIADALAVTLDWQAA